MPKIGLALGSGASRGWSHVGVIKALLEAGIKPDVVCGTSVGAMVGASYLAGNLDKLEHWVLGSSRTDVLRFFSFRLANSAFVDIERLNWFLHEFVADADVRIEELPKPYAAVCTDLESGREVLLQKGSVADAVRASMACQESQASIATAASTAASSQRLIDVSLVLSLAIGLASIPAECAGIIA
jgi:NTE family protein